MFEAFAPKSVPCTRASRADPFIQILARTGRVVQNALMTNPVLDIDLAKAGVTSIVWATGYALDFSWVKFDAFDDKGRPLHQRGVSAVPGFYFLGLPWLSRRASSFIWGVSHDAEYLADHIARRGSARKSPNRADPAGTL